MTEQELNQEIEDNTPAWINEGLTRCDIDSIQRGGCSSGAYMPAVTYYQASQTMADHGDDVLEYLDTMGYMEEISPPKDSSWSGIAVFYLSWAVEAWASQWDLDNIEEADEENTQC